MPNLERLPRGITGFFHAPDELPRVDPGLFRTACHVAARDMRASVRMVDDEGHLLSYLAAILEGEGVHIAVLCNRVHPYLGFIAAEALPIGHDGPAFLPCPVQSGWAGFHLPDPDVLNAELRPDMLRALAPCELHQIHYWKPARVGDLIFNIWD